MEWKQRCPGWHLYSLLLLSPRLQRTFSHRGAADLSITTYTTTGSVVDDISNRLEIAESAFFTSKTQFWISAAPGVLLYEQIESFIGVEP